MIISTINKYTNCHYSKYLFFHKDGKLGDILS